MTVAFNALAWCLWFSLWPAPRPGANGEPGRLATGANLSRGGAVLALVANSHNGVNAAYEALSGLAEEAKKIAVVFVVGALICYAVLELSVRHLPADEEDADDPESPRPPARALPLPAQGAPAARPPLPAVTAPQYCGASRAVLCCCVGLSMKLSVPSA